MSPQNISLACGSCQAENKPQKTQKETWTFPQTPKECGWRTCSRKGAITIDKYRMKYPDKEEPVEIPLCPPSVNGPATICFPNTCFRNLSTASFSFEVPNNSPLYSLLSLAKIIFKVTSLSHLGELLSFCKFLP